MSANSASSPQILMLVTYDISDEDREKFEAIASAHASAQDTYPGCISFSVGKDVQREGRYQLTELWESQELLDAHAQTEAFQHTMQALKSLNVLGLAPVRFEVNK